LISRLRPLPCLEIPAELKVSPPPTVSPRPLRLFAKQMSCGRASLFFFFTPTVSPSITDSFCSLPSQFPPLSLLPVFRRFFLAVADLRRRCAPGERSTRSLAHLTTASFPPSAFGPFQALATTFLPCFAPLTGQSPRAKGVSPDHSPLLSPVI